MRNSVFVTCFLAAMLAAIAVAGIIASAETGDHKLTEARLQGQVQELRVQLRSCRARP